MQLILFSTLIIAINIFVMVVYNGCEKKKEYNLRTDALGTWYYQSGDSITLTKEGRFKDGDIHGNYSFISDSVISFRFIEKVRVRKSRPATAYELAQGQDNLGQIFYDEYEESERTFTFDILGYNDTTMKVQQTVFWRYRSDEISIITFTRSMWLKQKQQEPNLDWSGIWSGPYSSVLEITGVTSDSLKFRIDASAGNNIGEVDGVAKITGKTAAFKDEEQNEIVFRLNGDTLTAETSEGFDRSWGGNGVTFGGKYSKNGVRQSIEYTNSHTTPSISVATVSVKRAYFYAEPNRASRKKAYLINGQEFDYNKVEGDFVFGYFTNDKGVKTEGWMLKSDFEMK